LHYYIRHSYKKSEPAFADSSGGSVEYTLTLNR